MRGGTGHHDVFVPDEWPPRKQLTKGSLWEQKPMVGTVRRRRRFGEPQPDEPRRASLPLDQRYEDLVPTTIKSRVRPVGLKRPRPSPWIDVIPVSSFTNSGYQRSDVLGA